jgi:hypothetical protein
MKRRWGVNGKNGAVNQHKNDKKMIKNEKTK